MTDWSSSSQSGTSVGVAKISEHFSATMMPDEMEEIKRKTGYKNPLKLTLSDDVLYIVENVVEMHNDSTVYALNVNTFDLQPIINVPNTAKFISFLNSGEQEQNLSIRQSLTSDECKSGVTLSDSSCFCQPGFSSKQTGNGLNCVESQNEEKKNFESVETVLYGVSDNSKDIYVVGYDKSHQVQVGPIQILENVEHIVYPRQIRYDSVDNCLYILTEFDGKIYLIIRFMFRKTLRFT